MSEETEDSERGKVFKEAFHNFDEAFEDALSELLALKPTEEELRAYFGPITLGHYIIKRMKGEF